MSTHGVIHNVIGDYNDTVMLNTAGQSYQDTQLALLQGQMKRTTHAYEESLVHILRAIESGRVDAARQAVTEAIARIVAQRFE